MDAKLYGSCSTSYIYQKHLTDVILGPSALLRINS
jgi:hypothetical protein